MNTLGNHNNHVPTSKLDLVSITSCSTAAHECLFTAHVLYFMAVKLR